MTDEDRDPYARRAERQLRQLEDLARLGAHLRLVLELEAVEAPVHSEVRLRGRSFAQLLHPLRTCTGGGLIGRHAHARQSGGVVQRLQRHRERNRAAVRVRHDAVVLCGARTVHLGYDERNAVLQSVCGGLVDRDCPAANRMRHELARGSRSDREEADVQIAFRQRLSGRDLDGDVAELLTGRSLGRKRADVRKAALAQHVEHDRAYRTGRTDDADARVLIHRARKPRAEPAPRGRRRCSRRGRRS